MSDVQAVATQSVVVERDLPRAAETVWRALTDPALLARWLMPNDFAPQRGRAFSFRVEAGAQSMTVACRVLEIDPPRRLVLQWGDGTPEGGFIDTVVTWTLTPLDQGVRVRMEQSGFGQGAERFRQGAEFGWPRFFAALETLVEEL